MYICIDLNSNFRQNIFINKNIFSAAAIGYSTRDIQQFELELSRPHGSPTKKLLWDWGTRGGTVRELYDKLDLINRTQSMRLLEHIGKSCM